MKTNEETVLGQALIIIQGLGLLTVAAMVEIVSNLLVISLEAAAAIVNTFFPIVEIVV
jgi:hypothetical protein